MPENAISSTEHNVKDPEKSFWAKIRKKRKEKKLALYLVPRILFYVCAPLTAVKACFSIPTLITSLAKIGGLGFLALIPQPLVWGLIIINVLYCIGIEQSIFYKHFITLFKQVLGKTKKQNYNTLTKDLIDKNNTLRKKQDLSVDTQTNNDSPIETKKRTFLRSIWYHARRISGYAFASFILSLRAIESSGRNTLGLMAIVLLFTANPPSIFILLFTPISLVGFTINNSQFIVQLFHETLKKLGFNRYIKNDYEKQLRIRRNLLKEKSIKDTLTESPIAASAAQASTSWRAGLYKLGILGYFIGSLGLSMAGFFTIDKFFRLMKGVAYLGCLALIPPPVAFAFALIMTAYILSVEQKILFKYVDELLLTSLGLNKNKNKKEKSIDLKIRGKQERITLLIAKLKEHLEKNHEANEADKADETYEATLAKLQSKFNEFNKAIQRLKSTPNIQDVKYSKSKIICAHLGTCIILMLRGLTSIGPQAMGLDIAFRTSIAFAAKLLGYSGAGLIGPWFFFPCFIIATLGYAIKSSRNITDQYRETLKVFGVEDPNHQGVKNKLYEGLDDIFFKLLELSNEITAQKCQFIKNANNSVTRVVLVAYSNAQKASSSPCSMDNGVDMGRSSP